MKDKQKYRNIGYHYTLKSPQYENCEVLGPDGNLMFRCCRKKANWYLDRKLGRQLREEPLTIQLTFVPKGVGHVNDPYFLQVMENRCVVCGSEKDLTRHHVVPYCYRKFFPTHLKQHRSYDVMALCIPCHHKYEEHALELKELLATKYSAPVGGIGRKFDKELSAARSAAKAILENEDKIPQERKDQLIELIKGYLNRDFTEEDLKALIDKNPYDFGNFVHHGKMVLDQVYDIEAFVREWRQHFVEKMAPRFLPSHWTIYRPVDYK
jgi:5-methylcytosine-specific restriction endonuclease McrA